MKSFETGAGAKKTYMEVREQLRLRELSKLKESMLVEMRKLNKPIRYRRENVLHLWKLREPKVVRTGKIILKNLVSLAKILCDGNFWLQEFRDIKAFSASTTWVCEIRSSFQEIPTTPNSHKIQRHKNFDQVLHWVSDEFEQSDKVYMTPFKEKYVEVYGSPAKNWEKVSRRVRGRLNLEAKSIMETYVGKRKKLCKRQIWFWVKKAWSWNGFRFFEKSNLWQFITFDCIWLFCKECSI